MKAAVWTAVLWSLCVSGIALAQDKAEEAAPGVEAQAAPQPQAPVTAVTPAAADEAPAPAEATKPEEAPPTADAPKAAEVPPAEAAPDNAAGSAHPERSAAEKAVSARPGQPLAFQSGWADASADEKALFLEAFGESSKSLQERWDKATPEERRKILRAHPLLSARPLKHRWGSATPEERAAFLEATPRIVQKVKEAWDSASPEQRKMLALEHPYFARKACHHGWMETTPQEKIAFLSAHPALQAELKARWTGASAAQKQWYVKNYPGLEDLGNGGHWADTSTEERALFLQANPAIAEKAREAWQKTQPEMRATMVRKWQGWPLRAYQARLESSGKILASAKTRPAATEKKTASAKPTSTGKPAATVKAPAKAAKK